VIEDDGKTISESSASTRASSVESEIGPVHLSRPHLRGQPKMLDCLDAPTIPEPPTESLDRPTSPAIPLPQHLRGRFVRVDRQGAAAVASPPSATTPPLPPPPEARTPAFEEEEWEIKKIVGKIWVGDRYQYKVRWEDTCLSESELGNAQGLVQDFKARRRGRGRKQVRPLRSNRVR